MAKYYKISEVATLLGYSRQHIYRLVNEELPSNQDDYVTKYRNSKVLTEKGLTYLRELVNIPEEEMKRNLENSEAEEVEEEIGLDAIRKIFQELQKDETKKLESEMQFLRDELGSKNELLDQLSRQAENYQILLRHEQEKTKDLLSQLKLITTRLPEEAPRLGKCMSNAAISTVEDNASEHSTNMPDAMTEGGEKIAVKQEIFEPEASADKLNFTEQSEETKMPVQASEREKEDVPEEREPTEKEIDPASEAPHRIKEAQEEEVPERAKEKRIEADVTDKRTEEPESDLPDEPLQTDAQDIDDSDSLSAASDEKEQAQPEKKKGFFARLFGR